MNIIDVLKEVSLGFREQTPERVSPRAAVTKIVMQLFATFVTLWATCWFVGCSDDSGGSGVRSAGHVYVTREKLETDKLASMWLIKSCVDTNAAFQFVADDQPLAFGIPVDAPEGEYRRYGSLSCFESVLVKHRIEDPAVKRLGRIIHDIEVNYWGEKHFPESAPLNHQIHAIIQRHPDRPEAALEESFRLFDKTVEDLRRQPESPSDKRPFQN